MKKCKNCNHRVTEIGVAEAGVPRKVAHIAGFKPVAIVGMKCFRCDCIDPVIGD